MNGLRSNDWRTFGFWVLPVLGVLAVAAILLAYMAWRGSTLPWEARLVFALGFGAIPMIGHVARKILEARRA